MTARKFHMISAQESGIGGFLLLFVLTQVLSLGLDVWGISGTIGALFGSGTAVADRSEPAYVPILSAVLLIQIARGVAFIIGLVLIFRRDPRTPKYYRFVLGAIIVIALIEAVGMTVGATVRTIGYGVIWFLYWRSSERVRLTFTPDSSTKEIPTTT